MLKNRKSDIRLLTACLVWMADNAIADPSANGAISDCDLLAANPGGCSEFAFQYRQLCLSAPQDDLCALLTEQLTRCGLDPKQLAPVAAATAPIPVAEFLDLHLLAPEGLRPGISLCEARSRLIERGFRESSACTFRRKGAPGARTTVRLYTDPSVELSARLGGHMFQIDSSWRCEGDVVGIEYRPQLAQTETVAAPAFFDRASALFGAVAECPRVYEPGLKDAIDGACQWRSVPNAPSVQTAALLRSSKGQIRLALLGTMATASKPSEASDSVSEVNKPARETAAATSPATRPKVTITLNKQVYQPGEQIEVTVKNLPGNRSDWLTLVRAGDPPTEWGQWTYMQGLTAGDWQFVAPKIAGDYEIRVYFNYPAGGFEIMGRKAVSISAE